MNVKNKRYQAIYYQHPKTDSIALYTKRNKNFYPNTRKNS